ncbi:MAG TPA: response regulator [Ktedonobacteraceae bacterium]|jgi:CheY-like chemotaxis protein
MLASRILLVEDDAVIRDLVRRNFQVRGYEVCQAADAHSALAHLQAAPIDLVILDINLPDLSGWDVSRIALQRGWLRPQVSREMVGDEGTVLATLPVVVLSAVRVSLARLREFHPLAYLPRPFPMDALLRLAAEAAEQKGGRLAAFPSREEPEHALMPLLEG